MPELKETGECPLARLTHTRLPVFGRDGETLARGGLDLLVRAIPLPGMLGRVQCVTACRLLPLSVSILAVARLLAVHAG